MDQAYSRHSELRGNKISIPKVHSPSLQTHSPGSECKGAGLAREPRRTGARQKPLASSGPQTGSGSPCSRPGRPVPGVQACQTLRLPHPVGCLPGVRALLAGAPPARQAPLGAHLARVGPPALPRRSVAPPWPQRSFALLSETVGWPGGIFWREGGLAAGRALTAVHGASTSGGVSFGSRIDRSPRNFFFRTRFAPRDLHETNQAPGLVTIVQIETREARNSI